MGTFSNKADLELTDDGVRVRTEGTGKKFVEEVQQITFSGDYALKSGQEITYITERCVFRLTPEGLMITEIAKGIDLEKRPAAVGQAAADLCLRTVLHRHRHRLFRQIRPRRQPRGLSGERPVSDRSGSRSARNPFQSRQLDHRRLLRVYPHADRDAG